MAHLPCKPKEPTMSLLKGHRTALVLVDYQQRLLPAIHGGQRAVDEALLLARVARELGIVVIGTEQNPAGLGPNVAAVREACDTTLTKMHFNACLDGLVEALRAREPALRQVVVAGCEAHVCLLQTALGLQQHALEVAVVASACGSRSPADHALAMQRLAQAGAVIVSPEMVAFEWLATCEHANFKAVLTLLKQRPLPAL
jgi:nicotinamidase-related amidase